MFGFLFDRAARLFSSKARLTIRPARIETASAKAASAKAAAVTFGSYTAGAPPGDRAAYAEAPSAFMAFPDDDVAPTMLMSQRDGGAAKPAAPGPARIVWAARDAARMRRGVVPPILSAADRSAAGLPIADLPASHGMPGFAGDDATQLIDPSARDRTADTGGVTGPVVAPDYDATILVPARRRAPRTTAP